MKELRLRVIEECVDAGYALPGERSEKGSALKEAADRLDLNYDTLRRWYLDNKEEAQVIIREELPPDDLGIHEILDFLEKRNSTKIKATAAKQWQEVRINSNTPCVIAFVGDPHLDSPGADLALLREHIRLMNQPNVYAFCVGDLHDNWVGNLMRLYANSDVSRETALKLIDWFMNDSGVKWLGFVRGNHDSWGNGSELLDLINKKNIMMEDWEIKTNLTFSSGLEIPIWISHDFKGKSSFNKVHGLVKAARERHRAKILVAGHTHDWGYYMEEMPDTNRVYHAIRARGYKFNDEHALVNGFPETKHGATMCAVIDPLATDPISEITVFPDLEKAILYKNALILNRS